MNKEINEIRNSIAQRKKKRQVSNQKKTNIASTPTMPNDEEKHGFLPSFPEVTSKGKQSMTFFNGLLVKACLSACLFLAAAVLLQSNNVFLDKPKHWASSVLDKEFPFAQVHNWYKETLGSPLAFSPMEHNDSREIEAVSLPVTGNIEEEFQINGSGIMISPEHATSVTAWDSGIIVFAGNDRKKDRTVIVQHANGSQSTYALLSSTDVHLYQAISAGERIGTFNPDKENGSVYFSLEKDNQYIDPVKVIQVDADDVP